MKKIRVVAAVILNNGEFLCVRRGENKLEYLSHKYEFPGGKIEEDEAEQEALEREIKEELLMEIQIKEKLMTVNHRYPDFDLEMHTYLCSSKDRQLTLTEHTSFHWSSKERLEDFDWAEADIPIVQKLKENG